MWLKPETTDPPSMKRTELEQGLGLERTQRKLRECRLNVRR